MDNIIFVGDKPFMNYITAVTTQFIIKKYNEVIIKARGKYISRAVDVVEIVRKKFFVNQIIIKNIIIDSEEVTDKNNNKLNVSSIEIILNIKM